MKGLNMNKQIEKDYEEMKAKVNKLLDQVDVLVCKFDEKYDVNLSSDLHFKLDEVSDMIQDNYTDADFDE